MRVTGGVARVSHAHSGLSALLGPLQECLKQCLSLLQSGVPVLFFPEGTRSKNGEMKSFKVSC